MGEGSARVSPQLHPSLRSYSWALSGSGTKLVSKPQVAVKSALDFDEQRDTAGHQLAQFAKRQHMIRRRLERRAFEFGRGHGGELGGAFGQSAEGIIVVDHRLAVGGDVFVEDGNKAARACAINLLAQIKVALGDLDKVSRVVRLGGFINSVPSFLDGPKVMNCASDPMVAAFGDKGRHARTTVGVAVLPLDAAVEIEGLFEIG